MFAWNTFLPQMFQVLKTFADLNLLLENIKAYPSQKWSQVSILSSNFCWFFSLRLHTQKVQNAQSATETKNVDNPQLLWGIVNESLKEE